MFITMGWYRVNMKCPNCVFELGYKKADGMKPIGIYINPNRKIFHEVWQGWCSHCGCYVEVHYPMGDVPK